MVSRKNIPALTPKDVLKQANYYIEYRLNSLTNEAVLFISWNEAKFTFKYNKETQELITNFNTIHNIKCPDYAVDSLIFIMVNYICLIYKYPYKHLLFFVDENPAKKLYYMNIKDPRSGDLITLAEEIFRLGLRKEHVDLAKEFKAEEGLDSICKYYLGVSLNK